MSGRTTLPVFVSPHPHHPSPHRAITTGGQTPTDLTDYILETDNARVALRRVQDRNFTDKQWQKIIDFIKGGYDEAYPNFTRNKSCV